MTSPAAWATTNRTCAARNAGHVARRWKTTSAAGRRAPMQVRRELRRSVGVRAAAPRSASRRSTTAARSASRRYGSIARRRAMSAADGHGASERNRARAAVPSSSLPISASSLRRTRDCPDVGTDRPRGRRHANAAVGRLATVMRTWTATTTVDAPPEAVLDVLTDPGACARWAPVDFEVDRPRRRGAWSPAAARACAAASPASRSASTSRSSRPTSTGSRCAPPGRSPSTSRYDLARRRRRQRGRARPSASGPAAASAAGSSPRPRPRCSAPARCNQALSRIGRECVAAA